MLSMRIANMLKEASPVLMDMYARARILESAKGMPKWSLSRNPLSLLHEGPMLFPDVDPLWFIKKDLGLASEVLRAANKILGAVSSGEASGEEIAQNMAAGLANSGEERSDIYGDVGKAKGAGILNGSVSPKDVKGALSVLAKNRAIDVWRKTLRHKKEREKNYPSLAQPGELSDVPAQVDVDRSPADVLMSLLSGPKGNELRNWIYKTVEQKGSPIQLAVFEAELNLMQKSHKDPAARDLVDEVARLTGGPPISLTAINKHRRNVKELLQHELKKNPKVLDWMDRYMDLAQLGYGGGQLRMASRIADRFLSGR